MRKIIILLLFPLVVFSQSTGSFWKVESLITPIGKSLPSNTLIWCPGNLAWYKSIDSLSKTITISQALTLEKVVMLGTTGGSGSVVGITANAPLSVTNPTTTPILSISQAGASSNGYLSSTDWNIFNNKSSFPGFGTSHTTAAYGDHLHSGVYEPALGNPAANGYVLSSTTAGVRSWIPSTGGSGGESLWADAGGVLRPIDTTYRVVMKNGTFIYPGDGDLNNSGSLSMTDFTYLRRYLVGLQVLTDLQKARADVDGDGRITKSDLNVLNMRIGNLDMATPDAIRYFNGVTLYQHYPGKATLSGSIPTVSTTGENFDVETGGNVRIPQSQSLYFGATTYTLDPDSVIRLYKSAPGVLSVDGKINPTLLKVGPYDVTVTANCSIPSGGTQVQSNWLQSTSTEPDYIKNKPSPRVTTPKNGLSIATTIELGSIFWDLSLKLASASDTGALKSGDWKRFDSTYNWGNHNTAGYIKPLGTGYIGDIIYSNTTNTWTRKPIGTPGQYLTVSNNLKPIPQWSDLPTIPAAQIQSDWNQSSTGALDYIKNKPTIPSGTVTSVTGTAPVVSSGGTTPAISMAAATTSVNGYLTSTDWNTFNNKVSFPGFGTSGSTAAYGNHAHSGVYEPVFSNGTSSQYLNGLKQWVNMPAVGGSGTVTSIAMGLGLASTQSPLTTTGTLSVDTSHSQILSRLRAANTYDIKPPNIIYVGATRAYTTIQSAINAATAGTVIKVDNGSYTEDLTIADKNRISIEGIIRPYWDYTTVTGGAILSGRIVIMRSSDITLSKLGIICQSGKDAMLISADTKETKDISIKDIIVKGLSGHHGMLIEEGSTQKLTGINVKDCEIHGGTHGFISKSQNTTFTNCFSSKLTGFGFAAIRDNGFGAALISKTKNVFFTNCIADSCTYGYAIYGKDWFSENAENVSDTLRNVQITGCSATNGNVGINIGMSSIYAFPKVGTGTSQVLAKDIIVNGFYGFNNSEYGIRIQYGDRITISGGSLYKNAVGFNNVAGTNVQVNGLINRGNTSNYASSNINDKIMVKDSMAAVGVRDYVTHKQLTTAIGSGTSQWTTTGSNIYYNTGKVGIGITAPTVSLHVTSTDDKAIFAQSSHASGFGVYGVGNVAGLNGLGGTFGVYGVGATAGIRGASDNAYGGYFTSKNATGLYVKSTSGNAAIFDSGNVGIGLTNPAYKLHVNGEAKIGTIQTRANPPTYALVDSAGLVTKYHWPDETGQWGVNGSKIYYTTGEVGIGNSNPTYPLYVVGTADKTIYAQSNHASGTGIYGTGNSVGVTGTGGLYGIDGTGTTAGVRGISTDGYGGSFSSTNSYGISASSATIAGPVALNGISAAKKSKILYYDAVTKLVSYGDSSAASGSGLGTVTSVTGTAPVVSSGGNTPAISMAAATTSVSGYLTATDWNTFNNKFSFPGFGTSGSTAAYGNHLHSGVYEPVFSNGTSAQYLNGLKQWVNMPAVGGTGTVTSISMGLGLASTQSPLTTTGTLSVDTSHSQILSRLRAANTYDIKPPNIIYVGATRAYTTIQSAINAATAGTVIKVDNGSYTENLTISEKDKITIDGAIRPYWNYSTVVNGAILTGRIFVTKSSSITINKIGIICPSTGDAILITAGTVNCKNIYLNDIVIKGYTQKHGIIIEEASSKNLSEIVVRNCEIHQGGHGFISKSQNTTFVNCFASKLEYFGFAAIADNGYGAALCSKTKNISFTNCIADSCTTAYSLYGKDWFSENASNVTDTLRNVQITGCSATNGNTGIQIGMWSADVFPKAGTGASQVIPKDIIVNGFYAFNNSFAVNINHGDRITFNGGSLYKNTYGYYNVAGIVQLNGLVSKGNTVNYSPSNLNDKIMVKDSTAAVGVRDYVTHKQLTAAIPAAQIQSDWNQTTNTALDYIKNKPTLTNGTVTSVTGTSPIVSSGGATPAISISTSGASNGQSLKFITGAWRPWADSVGTGGSSQWTTNGNNIYYNTGNVGVGVTAPAYKLDIRTNIAGDRALRAYAGGTGANIAIEATGYYGIRGTGSYVGVDAVSTGGTALSAYSYNGMGINGMSENGTGATIQSNAGVALQAKSNTGNQFIFGNNMTFPVDSVMVMLSNGNVGIGTTNPGYTADITGTLRATGKAYLNDTATIPQETGSKNINLNTAGGLTIRNYGNNPLINLRRYNGTYKTPTPIVSNNTIGVFNVGGCNHTSGTEIGANAIKAVASENWSSTANGFYFAFSTIANTTTVPAERMRLKDDGTVGVGTTAPTAKLDINSDLIRLRTAKTPATSTSAGNIGDIGWNTNSINVAVADNKWKRTPLDSITHTGNITASTGITAAMLSSDMRYNGNSDIDITANPQIADGYDGQVIVIINVGYNFLKFDTGTGLVLNSSLGKFAMIRTALISFKYVASLDLWLELYRSYGVGEP